MNVAIIGLGQRVAQVWRVVQAAAGGNLHLTGYADPSPSGLGVLEQAGLDPGRAFVDHRAMLAELRPEAVLIGSPNHLHLAQLADALDAGCRIFCEKPVVISPEETWAAAEVLARHGPDRVQVGLVLRSSPFFRAVQGQMPRLGRLVSLEASEHLEPEHGGFIMRDWRRRRAWSGSHILEKCCHDIDLLQAIAGRIVRSASFGGRSVFTPENASRERDGRYHAWAKGWQSVDAAFASDADIVDHQVAICETETGVRLAFHANNHCAAPRRRWLLCGVDGSLEGDFRQPTLSVQRVHAASETLAVPGAVDGHYGADPAMAADLCACWLDGRPFPVPAKAALEAGLACMAIDAAQREGRVVDSRDWLQRLDGILA